MTDNNIIAQARRIMSRDIICPTHDRGYTPSEMQHFCDSLPDTDTLKWCNKHGCLVIPTRPRDLGRLGFWGGKIEIDSTSESKWIIVKKNQYGSLPLQSVSALPTKLAHAEAQPLSFHDIYWVGYWFMTHRDHTARSAVQHTISIRRGDEGQLVRSYVTLNQESFLDNIIQDYNSGRFKPFGWKF
jgi:hypothetical protein